MITITIKNNDVTISTEDKNTTGCTEKERQLLLNIAKSLCDNCSKEGAE